MGTIRVEFVPIKKFNLGLLGFDHLQIVYEDETSFINKQDNWYVLEGTHDGGLFDGQLGVLGEAIRTELSAANGANGADLVAAIGTPEMRGSRIVYQGPDALVQWDRMMAWGQEIEAQDFPYEGLSFPFSPGAIINSSSVVATLLYLIGVDVNIAMPFNVGLAPGTATLLGTTGNDDITIAGSFTQVAGGFGEDTLRGSRTFLFPEKFYGGDDDDTIVWSMGANIVHGGQPRLAYALDGNDTIDYSGIGFVRIEAVRHSVEHKVADFASTFDGGSDLLFSIESVNWSRETDIISIGEGVDLLERPVKLDLDQSAGGKGDELSFLESSAPLIVNAVTDTAISVQTLANQGLDAGFWVQSVEWLAGSAGDDLIYAGATLKGIDGGEGGDLLDGRLAQAYSRDSLNGFDIELIGGSGDDTLVSGTGYSLAAGGEGADTFVLSAVTASDTDTTEFVIADADASDALYLPYDFFKELRGEFDGSQLMQLRGAPFRIDDITTESLFYWGIPGVDDPVHGNIDFVGLIRFFMEESDLMISIMQAHVEEELQDNGPGEPPGPLIRRIVGEAGSETFVRVVDWQDGDLGISFPLTYSFAEQLNATEEEFYPGFGAALDNLVNPSIFKDALELRPDAYIPQDLADALAPAAPVALRLTAAAPATEGDDVINLPSGGPYEINGLGGNDTITGSAGGDVIDGGSGNDIMAGGRGNDVYVVDSALDTVIEETRGGFDRVYASIDYALGDEVEHLTLTGTAVNGTGNGLRNTVTGNDADNTLSGGGGDDTLAGNRGNDTLIGGEGADGYVYELGDGDDIIIEAAGASGSDVLVFAGQMAPEDFSFFRSPQALDDLIIRFFGGGSITLPGFFAAAGSLIEGVEFAGTGVVWSSDAFAVAAESAILSDNEAPVAREDAYIFAGESSFRLPVAALLENDGDADGDQLTIISVIATQGGAVLDGSDIVVTAASATDPRALFSYTISDGEGGTATTTANISFVANSAPVITSAQLAPVRAGSAAAGVLTAIDADGDTLLYEVKAGEGPQRGSVLFTGAGAFTYTPFANATGPDTFTLVVTDPFGASAEHVFAFDIEAGVNHTPVIETATLSAVSEDAPATGVFIATDEDGDALTYSVKAGAGPALGSVTFGADGAFTYAPDANANGSDGFTLLATDAFGHNAEHTFSFTIAAVNDAPQASNDTGFTMSAGGTLTLASGLLTANDTDIDGDALSVVAAGDAYGGSVTLGAGGIVFTAGTGFSGTAHFAYTVTDGAGGSDTATAFITVEEVVPPPGGLVLVGTNHRDVLNGSAYGDLFNGKKGRDVLIAGAGDDTFIVNGDDGRDLIDAGTGYDILQGGAGSDVLRVSSGFANLQNLEEIDGGDGFDILAATRRDDVLDLAQLKIKNVELVWLGRGDDRVTGTSADETFSGGEGSDVFRFRLGCGNDTIRDFSAGPHGRHGGDVLDLRDWDFSSLRQLFAHARQSGADLIFDLDAHSSITLENVTLRDLHRGDILL